MRITENSRLIALCLSLLAVLVMRPPATGSVQTTHPNQEPPSRKNGDGIITGRVLAEDGRPATGAEVTAEAIGGEMFDSYTTQCDDTGYFKLMALKPDAYRVNARLPGYFQQEDDSSDGIHWIGENLTLRISKGGVITGRVTDVQGEPLVGANINLQRTRDDQGRKRSDSFSRSEFVTDDRGVYRLYEIPPGVYIVSAVDIPIARINSGGIPHHAPTYYPSVKREVASEIIVRNGEIVNDVDIRHRGDPGYSITGYVSGSLNISEMSNPPAVLLINGATREIEAGTLVTGVFDSPFRKGARHFTLFGVPDGVYQIQLTGGVNSIPQQIKVQGGDVADVNVKILALTSVTGRLVIEKTEDTRACGGGQTFSLKEFVPQVKPINDEGLFVQRITAPVSEAGEFALRLKEGRYRFVAHLPNSRFYLTSIKTTDAKASDVSSRKMDLARDGLAIADGEGPTHVEIGVTEGAAGLREKIAPADAGKPPIDRSLRRMHLVPAEESAIDDVLRYAETRIQEDGNFELNHLAPGKYFLVEQPAKVNNETTPLAWDAAERVKLHRKARLLKQEIVLRPCQQSTYVKP